MKHDTLIQHAQSKFTELEGLQQALVDAAKDKFVELEQRRAQFEQDVASKVVELDQKMIEENRVCAQAARVGCDTLGGSDGRRFSPRHISESKAIQFLENTRAILVQATRHCQLNSRTPWWQLVGPNGVLC